jgi:hypothetical protein
VKWEVEVPRAERCFREKRHENSHPNPENDADVGQSRKEILPERVPQPFSGKLGFRCHLRKRRNAQIVRDFQASVKKRANP